MKVGTITTFTRHLNKYMGRKVERYGPNTAATIVPASTTIPGSAMPSRVGHFPPWGKRF